MLEIGIEFACSRSLGFSQGENFTYFAVLAVFYGLLFGAATTILFAMGVETISSVNRGGAVSVNGVMTELGIILGSGGAGFLLQKGLVDLPGVFVVGGMSVFVGLLCFLALHFFYGSRWKASYKPEPEEPSARLSARAAASLEESLPPE